MCGVLLGLALRRFQVAHALIYGATHCRCSLCSPGLGIALIILGYLVLPAVAAVSPSKLNWVILISPTVYTYSQRAVYKHSTCYIGAV
jgi:hypothetical protein